MRYNDTRYNDTRYDDARYDDARTGWYGAQQRLEWANRLLILAQRCARRYGLPPDEADDCAMDCVMHVLIRCHWPDVVRPDDPPSEAWVYRCITNYTLDYKRAYRRLSARECSATDILLESVGTVGPSGEARLMRSWCLEQVVTAIGRLSHVQRRAFVSYYVEGVSIPRLAATLQLSPHAVEQCLFRARRRLRELLTRQGFAPGDLSA